MDIKNMGDDELQSLFEEAFSVQVAAKNNIADFEVKTNRDVNSNKLSFEVTVIGLAGTPSIDSFKKGDVEEAKSVFIERADKGGMKLNLEPEKTVFLSGNDYIIVYANE